MNTWNENELSYCARLVKTRGNSAVPRAAVGAYLLLQAGSAERDASRDVPDAAAAAKALYALETHWQEVMS